MYRFMPFVRTHRIIVTSIDRQGHCDGGNISSSHIEVVMYSCVTSAEYSCRRHVLPLFGHMGFLRHSLQRLRVVLIVLHFRTNSSTVITK